MSSLKRGVVDRTIASHQTVLEILQGIVIATPKDRLSIRSIRQSPERVDTLSSESDHFNCFQTDD